MTAYGSDRDDPLRNQTDRPDAQTDRPLTALLSQLATETTTLVRKEVELARAEMSEKVSQATAGVTSLAAGGLIAYAGLLFLLLAATLALSNVVAPWLAALIVGGITALVGIAMLMAGKRKLNARNLQPTRTLETLREDKDWAQSQLQR